MAYGSRPAAVRWIALGYVRRLERASRLGGLGAGAGSHLPGRRPPGRISRRPSAGAPRQGAHLGDRTLPADADGNVYVTDGCYTRIQKFSSEGVSLLGKSRHRTSKGFPYPRG
jgi:hypothetical protein